MRRSSSESFFTYDSSGICIESTVDDGSSRHKSHFTNATRRTIHRVIPRHKMPFYGTPDEEQWLVYTRAYGEQFVKGERYTRDNQGRAIAKELVDGFGIVQKRWIYSYDDVHRLTESRDPTGRVEQFSYDDVGRLAMKHTPEATITFTYDLFDRCIEERKTFPDGTTDSVCRQYDLPGRIVTEIDGRGREKTTVKNLAGRLVKTVLPAIATETGARRPEMTYSYSGSTERCTCPSGAVTEITRSATGKPLVSTSPSGAKTYFFYDARNRLVEQKDPLGLVTRYEYDAFDRPTKVEQTADGQSLSVVTKTYRGFDLIEERHRTRMISFTYDSLGRKVQEDITDLLTSNTVTTRTHYDTLHRPIRIFHDDIGTEDQLTYDVADRAIEQRVIGADGSLLSIATKSYDFAGRVVEEGMGRAGAIARTKTAYGAYGLPSSVTQPDGTVTTFAYNPLCRWHDGHVYFHKVMTDPRGVVAEELLDSNDEVRFAIVRDPFGGVISKRMVTFSILGKPVLIEEEAIASGHEATPVKTRLEYDNVGQLVACTLAADTTEAATWLYLYDQEGRKIEEIKPSGEFLSSSYDVKGRLTSLKSSDGSISWGYHYNNQGLPEAITNEVSGCTTQRRYNGLGVMIEETLETGLTLAYDVQATGLLSSITYPDGSLSTYAYVHGRLTSIERNGYAYRVNSRDTSGMITSASLPASVGQITQAVDVMGRRTLVHHDAFSEERTVFDPVGCCLERTIDGKNEVFTYDFLCQLTNDNGRTACYDSLFRRIETEGKAAVHNDRHQILSQGDRDFHYDIDGRRTSDDRFRYSYDSCDRLRSVEDDATRFEYSYDPFNRRLSSARFIKDESGWRAVSQERYVWQGDCEIGSVDADSHFISLRVLGEGLGGEIGAAVLFEVNGEVYIPIHDLSGHVRACLNTSGDVVEKLSYTAFGLESRTANITPWTFSSKRQDEVTGFLYFGRRFYESETATWLTQDPLGFSAGPNLYAYVKNNPLTSFDIFGLIDQASDRGFWGGLWDRCCDFFGGIFGDLSCGSGGSAQASETSIETPAPRESENKNDTLPAQLRNGVEIEAGKKYSDMRLIYPYGSVKEFLEANQGKDLGRSVFVGIFGAGTTLHDCCLRAKAFMEKNQKSVVAVIILYNATHGLPNDLVEAALNTLGFELTVGK
jgi:RHS repeat-associated protein